MNNSDEEINTALATNNETTTTTKPSNTKLTTKSTHKCSVNCNCSASQKRPMNAFLIFCKRHRSVVKQKYSHLENRSITKILGQMWAGIPLEQKQKYTELARQYKEAFMKANPHFKWYGSKWYKTDINLPSNMQPSCSPPYVPFSSSNSTINNSSSSLNCNLFNNTSTNFQNESNNSTLTQSNGSNSTNQSDSNQISTTNNDKTTDKNNSNSFNLTPKPPKKRYLENGEFKEPTTQTTSASAPTVITNNDCKTATSSSIAKINTDQTSTFSTINSQGANKQNSNYAIGGPPVLDIETMNRVIENAFSSSSFGATNSSADENSSNKKSFNKTNKMKNDSQKLTNLFSNSQSNTTATNLSTNTSRKSSLNKGNDNEIKGDKSNDLRCNEKFNEPADQKFELKTNLSPPLKSTNPTKSGKLTKSSVNNQSKQDKLTEESRSNSPLNNSVIDIFVNSSNKSSTACNLDKEKNRQNKKLTIDKNDEEEEDDDKPLNLSSTHTVNVPKNQVLIDNLIDKLLSDNAEGNPMPIEMLQSSTNNFNTSNSSTFSSKSHQQNQQRKERSCKGKRYLEMLNENKLTKRSKNAPTSSICINGEESNGSNKNSSTSKWISGSFDLEERIAALPQLGDSQLINVLDSTKTINLTKSSTSSADQQDANNLATNNNILLNNNEHNLNKDCQSSSSKQLENKHSSSTGHFMDTTSTISKYQSNENVNENNRQIESSQLSNSSTDLAEKIVERLNINSQNLNECDGLVALAEIALQRESHRISPSCT